MVSLTWMLVSFMSGILALVLIALLGQAVALDLRQRIARPYFKWSETVLGPSAIVWRKLGRPTLKPISIDDEREVAEVTQSSGTLSDDQKLPFRDPADAKRTLFKKQLTLVPEGIPAAVDAEMAELAYWWDAKANRDGLLKGNKVDPYVPLHDQPRSVNPHDIITALDEDVTPEDMKTTERHTRARFEKYGGGPTAKEAGAMLGAFAVGAGIVMGAVYLRTEVIGDGAGGGVGGGTVPVPMVDMVQFALDGLVILT